jgi:hypothetical protein
LLEEAEAELEAVEYDVDDVEDDDDGESVDRFSRVRDLKDMLAERIEDFAANSVTAFVDALEGRKKKRR